MTKPVNPSKTTQRPNAHPDKYGRTVNYVRLSLTDRCNLRCFYCRSEEGVPLISHNEILRYEEFLRLIKLAQRIGVQKVRITGGEAMVRREFMSFIEDVMAIKPKVDLRLTTNGTLLPGKVRQLKEIGLTHVNISLDALNRETFHKVTGRDLYNEVRQAIDECLECGLRVKINAVALRGINQCDLAGFLDLARNNPIDIRFIEFMPMGKDTAWQQDYFWAAQDILREAQQHANLTPIPRAKHNLTSGPAQMYEIENGQGRIGLISPLSNHFCKSCNRLRITCDGKLRTCLFSDREYNLRNILRHPKLDDEAVLRVMQTALTQKPLGHNLLEQKKESVAVCGKVMSGIGG